MLEVKNLTKIYSGKGGVTVKALDDVSVVFPEKGMVFLLGKSGSGKSTLLNVAGGLDKPDDGEVIVKGKSSKDFSGSDFDSYRNTFIGFVFQEYNILNEFTIEQNIALALQLQSKPNDKKAVADLLEQVDLAGYAKRKPNTLSGGQKQRVAIARALIKEPEIIMADEPTGALDSNTGKQVLDTLKKLSEQKLVIVVSHDREFAEYYGDRIIELKDGKIISDVSKVYNTPATLDGVEKGEQTGNVAVVSENTISIKDAEALTEEEITKIGKMLRAQKGEVIITADDKDLPGVKRACKIGDNGSKESFRETTSIDAKEYDGSKTEFIKSRLPLGHAVKMGASGLKSKPFRLIFTILLAVAAFVLFGVASTFMLYDPNYSVSEALREADYPAATISKTYAMTIKSYRVDQDGKKEFDYDYTEDVATRFGASETEERGKSGLSFAGIFNFTDNGYSNEDIQTYELRLVNGSAYTTPTIAPAAQDYYSILGTIGFSDCGAAYLAAQGYTLLAGAYPTDKTGIALPDYLAETFVGAEEGGIRSVDDLIGRKVRVSADAIRDESLTITGIYTLGNVPEKYLALKDLQNANRLDGKEKDDIKNAFKDYLKNSFHLVVFVTPDFYEAYKDRISSNGGFSVYVQQESYKGIRLQTYAIDGDVDPSGETGGFYTDKTLRLFGNNAFRFFTSDGVATTFDANAGGAYLIKSAYTDLKNRQLDDLFWRLITNLRYVPEAYTEYNADDFQNKQNSGKDAGYAVRLAFLKKYQSKIYYRYYLYSAAKALSWSGDPAYQSGDFYDAFQVIYEFVDNYWDKENLSVPTDETWRTIEDAVNALPEKTRYGYLLETLRNVFGYGTIFTDREDDTVMYALKDGSLSDQDFITIKEELNAFMTGKGIGAFSSEKPFDLLERATASNEFKLYYVDKNGDKGDLPILGYFEIVGSEWGANYFLSASFLDAHAYYVPYEGTYQITETSSNYVAPADAKYNYLISPTDNSTQQISAILSTEKDTKITIESKVYEELQRFLELIKDLEKIFLYVGLGVGALAAFFLLNFISVSISSKRKDIGILRAVGARGSDVFKIFYAEALIIALICFVLASVVSFVVCFELNKTLVEAVSIKLLNFGLPNIGLVFGISLFVSVIATFFPVYFAAKKSPVEAIRAL